MDYYCQLLNVQQVGGIRQTEIQTAAPFVPELSISVVGADQIPAELIQVGGELHSEIHKFIKLIWNKEELPHQWKESIVMPIHKKGDKTECSNYQGISLLPT
jgi:hypothetical protein